jgi:xanthine dehydrogenase accessory factor
LPYTGAPTPVQGISFDRVLRASVKGIFKSNYKIGDKIKAGQKIGEVSGTPIVSKIEGVIRGLIHNNLEVLKGQKIGDIDPRNNVDYCLKISDKAESIAKGVLKAIIDLKQTSKN